MDKKLLSRELEDSGCCTVEIKFKSKNNTPNNEINILKGDGSPFSQDEYKFFIKENVLEVQDKFGNIIKKTIFLA